jgi:ATP-dependent helicase HrpB
MSIDSVNEVRWLDAPPAAAVESAESLLDRLGATGAAARRLARFPLTPRHSRLLIEAIEREAGEDGCVAAALLSSGIDFGSSDLLEAMDMRSDPRLLRPVEQLRRITRVSGPRRHGEEDLLKSVLTGFPDRVARLRAGNQVLLSTGGSAEVMGQPPKYEFMVALDAEDRKDKPLPLIRMTARIEPEWLIDLFPDRVREQKSVLWSRTAERVEAVSELLYDNLVIDESRGGAPDVQMAAALLAEKAIEAGMGRFVDEEKMEQFLARIEFAGFEQPGVEGALREICAGINSFVGLKAAARNFLSMLEQRFAARRLQEIAPESLRLASGRQTKIHYERGKPPWIASRLQDFFGMRETPRIGPKPTPVVVHLLAPNHRPVQTTTDLAGFWERLYPAVRRELMRRYPRHSWPERP